MKYLSWFSEMEHQECIYPPTHTHSSSSNFHNHVPTSVPRPPPPSPSQFSITSGMAHFIVLQAVESGRGTRIEYASYQHLNENRLHKYGVDMAGVNEMEVDEMWSTQI